MTAPNGRTAVARALSRAATQHGFRLGDARDALADAAVDTLVGRARDARDVGEDDAVEKALRLLLPPDHTVEDYYHALHVLGSLEEPMAQPTTTQLTYIADLRAKALSKLAPLNLDTVLTRTEGRTVLTGHLAGRKLIDYALIYCLPAPTTHQEASTQIDGLRDYDADEWARSHRDWHQTIVGRLKERIGTTTADLHTTEPELRNILCDLATQDTPLPRISRTEVHTVTP